MEERELGRASPGLGLLSSEPNRYISDVFLRVIPQLSTASSAVYHSTWIDSIDTVSVCECGKTIEGATGTAGPTMPPLPVFLHRLSHNNFHHCHPIHDRTAVLFRPSYFIWSVYRHNLRHSMWLILSLYLYVRIMWFMWWFVSTRFGEHGAKNDEIMTCRKQIKQLKSQLQQEKVSTRMCLCWSLYVYCRYVYMHACVCVFCTWTCFHSPVCDVHTHHSTHTHAYPHTYTLVYLSMRGSTHSHM